MSRHKKVSRSLEVSDSLHYLCLAYRDYVAARFLLNNNFLIQGITLSSTAVEKYLKVLLSVKNVQSNHHLNQASKIKGLISRYYPSLYDNFDKKYMALLGEAYELRYYDKISKKTILVHKWQALGELDSMISFIESILEIRYPKDKKYLTDYEKSVKESDKAIWDNNYILNNIPKKDFMEKKGPSEILCFDIALQKRMPVNQLVFKINDMGNEYDGTINSVSINIDL